jgi:hypothetical protein
VRSTISRSSHPRITPQPARRFAPQPGTTLAHFIRLDGDYPEIIGRNLKGLCLAILQRQAAKAGLSIEAAVRISEMRHSGEIRYAIENSLAPGRVWRGVSGRERAIEVFANLHVWDTEHNSGVLIYLLLADHDIEIVADRGIAARVPPEVWEQVAQTMETALILEHLKVYKNGLIKDQYHSAILKK